MKPILLFIIFSVTVHFNLNAQIIWQNTIGGNSFDHIEDVIPTSDGGFMLIGSSESGISGDKSEASKGAADYWIVKTNSSGVVQWDKTYGGSGDDYAVTAIETADGSFVILGDSDSDISGDKSENSRGFTDVWVVKTNGSGSKTWDKTLGGDADEETTVIELTADGGYILGVIAESGISGDKTINTSNNEDYWVIKINASNTIDWQKTYGGTSEAISILTVLMPTDDGGYILAGDSDSNIGGDKTENSKGESDLWVLKINSTGTIEWQSTLGGDSFEYEPSGFKKAGGGYVFACTSSSNISGDKTESSNGDDIWLVELDSNGNLVGEKTFGTGSDEFPQQVLSTSDGHFIIVSDVDEASGDNTEAPNGDSDYWLFKVNNSTLSLEENKFMQHRVSVFPNPTSGNVNIKTNQKIEGIEIFDVTGKLISTPKPINNTANISHLPQGLYVLRIHSKNEVVNQRMVKK
ncbi:T9SS type A sorting domain-containing protein [Tamlana crocina]|uniref:T9SS type A sorting domain-containing protein n=1 Tax=Tamlana crocina TaxID=393006 RepID=A0ABX1DDB4_9FLAO|nr:T9SS type A sorting domain-containing protein [Tamlana crocina]NJX16345.1 T9SS type A sorting domain-containing protein [Tamlana crocina]